MWTSRPSTSRVNVPSARPRARIASISSIAGEPSSSRFGQLREVLGAMDVLDRHEPDEVGVRLVVVEGQLGDPADRGDRVEMIDRDRLLLAADLRVGRLQDRGVEPLLGLEVVVDHPLRRAGELGDLVDARAGIAMLGELARGDGEDLGPGALAVPRGGHGIRVYGPRVVTYRFVHYDHAHPHLPRRPDRVRHLREPLPRAARARGGLPRPRVPLRRARARGRRRRGARPGPRGGLRRRQRHPPGASSW